MKDLSKEASEIKSQYRETFIALAEEISKFIESTKPQNLCKSCGKNCSIDIDILSDFPSGCTYKLWQNQLIKYLETNFIQKIVEKWQYVQSKRQDYRCCGCGTCCKLAVSEFSPQELQQKSECGDNFAKQFLSVFVPYVSEDEARQIFPEYFDMLDKDLKKEEKTYFYHCPKVTYDNRCPDYQNRPQICKDFPDNPLGFLPLTCSFNAWKKEVEPVSLKLHAAMDIVDFYKSKIQN